MTSTALDTVAFARRLSDARIASGRTIQDTAAVCGIPLPTLEAYLYRQHLPSASVLFKLARGLGVSADWLLFGEGARNG